MKLYHLGYHGSGGFSYVGTFSTLQCRNHAKNSLTGCGDIVEWESELDKVNE